MNKKKFVELMDSNRRVDELRKTLKSCGIDIIDCIDTYIYPLFDFVLESYFTEEGLDIIYWWLYEAEDKVLEFDEETLFGTEHREYLLGTAEDLYDYVEQYLKK